MEKKIIQTLNKVEIAGVVKENKLRLGENLVKGSVIVQYGEKAEDQIEVNVYCTPKYNNGSENKNYQPLRALTTSLVSKAKATEERPADIVSIYGYGNFVAFIKLDEYAKNGKVISIPKVALGNGTMRVAEVPEKDFKAEFAIDAFLTKKPTIDEATGYLKVQGLTVSYQGVVSPIDFVVKEEELIDGISECEANSTASFWGDIKIAHIEEVKKIKSGFGGKAKTETKVTNTRELVITGGDFIPENDKRYVEPEFIKKAMGEREIHLQELINKEGQKSTPKRQGGFGGSSQPNFGSPSQIKDSDVPF